MKRQLFLAISSLGLAACGTYNAKSNGSANGSSASNSGSQTTDTTNASAALSDLSDTQDDVTTAVQQDPSAAGQEFTSLLTQSYDYLVKLIGLDPTQPLGNQQVDLSTVQTNATTIENVLTAEKAVLKDCLGFVAQANEAAAAAAASAAASSTASATATATATATAATTSTSLDDQGGGFGPGWFGQGDGQQGRDRDHVFFPPPRHRGGDQNSPQAQINDVQCLVDEAALANLIGAPAPATATATETATATASTTTTGS